MKRIWHKFCFHFKVVHILSHHLHFFFHNACSQLGFCPFWLLLVYITYDPIVLSGGKGFHCPFPGPCWVKGLCKILALFSTLGNWCKNLLFSDIFPEVSDVYLTNISHILLLCTSHLDSFIFCHFSKTLGEK